MNRYITWILLIVILLGVFAGCKKDVAEPTTSVTEATADIYDAMAFLKNLYKNDGAQTPVDFKRFCVVRIAGIPFEVKWTTGAHEDAVKIVENGNSLVTIDVNEQCVADTPYVLTATLYDDTGTSISYSWNYLLPAAVAVDNTIITDSATTPNETLSYESTLSGKVTSIETPYDKNNKCICVVIAVNGFENLSVLCRQMIGEDAADVKVGDIITVTGVLKDDNGRLEFEPGCVLVALFVGATVETPADTKPNVDNNLTLETDQNQSYEVTLTGLITKVNTAYNASAGNVTVTMVIAGSEDKPVLCYRMKGTGIDKIDVGDTITVKGYIISSIDDNGKTSMSFRAECILVSYKKNENVAPSNPIDIVKAAYALKAGTRLPYKASLTGKITKVNTAYSASYKNVTVTIEVDRAEDMPIMCYRLKGDGVDKIGIGDTITVTGYIEKFQHTAELAVVEFAADCQMISWVDTGIDISDVTDKPDVTDRPDVTDKPDVGNKPANPDTPEIDTGASDSTANSGSAYILAFDKNGVKRYFNGQTESAGITYRLATTSNLDEAVTVRLQSVSGGYALYFMNGAKKTYIRIYERDAANGKGSLELVSAAPAEVLTFDATYDTLVYKSSSANSYYLGTYSTYTTLSVSNLSAVNSGNVGISYFPARLYDLSEVSPAEPITPPEPTTSTAPTTPTTPPEPTTPATPTTPTTPTEPTTQTAPTAPSEPSLPTTPSTPTIPSSPSSPSVPDLPEATEGNTDTIPTEPTVSVPESTPSELTAVAMFDFPDGTPGAHNDGDNAGYEGYVYTSGSYSLTFTEYSKAYFGGYDQLGNGFVKFGSSSSVGSVAFVVPDDVTKVELHLAKYKAKTSKCSINGGAEIILSKSCSVGEYDVVTVDTSVNKTVKISTASDAPRMVMYAIIYYS